MQRAAPDPAAIKKAVEMLLAAKHPLLWAGQGVHYAEAGDRLAALAELLPAPVVATNPGKSAIPDSHPLALGGATRSRSKVFADFMKKSDVVMAIGSSLTITNFGPSVPPGKTIIHSTNDAGDINKEYRADHAVVGDAGLVIDALIAEISKQKGPGGGNALASLKEEVAAGKKAWLDEWAKFLNSDEMPLNQYRVIRDMMRTLDRDNVIITHDSGSPREQMIPFWETTAAGSYMGWGKSTQLGYGLGITMGAKLAAPKKLCINVMGDAAIGMTGMDIETAARNRIAILTVVFNNGVMGAERDVLKISDAEIRRHDGRRQLHEGGRGPQCRGDARGKARRHRRRDQGGGRRHGNGRAVPARIRGQRGPRFFALRMKIRCRLRCRLRHHLLQKRAQLLGALGAERGFEPRLRLLPALERGVETARRPRRSGAAPCCDDRIFPDRRQSGRHARAAECCGRAWCGPSPVRRRAH